VTNQPGQKTVSYSPLAGGRTYTVQANTNLAGGAYATLTGFTGPVTNGSATQASVVDTNAALPTKFYRVQISQP
jgi:hypothetical protein